MGEEKYSEDIKVCDPAAIYRPYGNYQILIEVCHKNG